MENETLKVAEQVVDNTMAEINSLLQTYETFEDDTVFNPYTDLCELSYSNWYMNGNL